MEKLLQERDDGAEFSKCVFFCCFVLMLLALQTKSQRWISQNLGKQKPLETTECNYKNVSWDWLRPLRGMSNGYWIEENVSCHLGELTLKVILPFL